jgi:methyl-accepting chemotaxis protein
MAAVLTGWFKRREDEGPARLPELKLDTEAQKRVVKAISHEASMLGREAALVAGVIDDVAKASVAQSQVLESLTAGMQLMAQANDAIRYEAEQSRGAASNARAAVERVGRGVQAASASLGKVFDAANEITRIALQTRLVAFNASVEAGRAGEAGRGFAVVAEAVKDLSQKVEISSKEIVSTIQALGEKIDQLSQDLIDSESENASRHGKQDDTFHARFKDIERCIAAITERAAANMSACQDVVRTSQAMGLEINANHRGLEQANNGVLTFLKTSEKLIELTAGAGVETEDTPYINAAVAGANELGQLLEEALASGKISDADLFDQNYVPVQGTNPQQFITRSVALTDRLFPGTQERIAGMDKVVFCAAVDNNGYLPTHNHKFSKPQGNDPVWNAANSRNRRMFADRTGLAAGRNIRAFILQTYRRDMGGGKFVVMKDLSAPITVRGRHWGGLRIGYQF